METKDMSGVLFKNDKKQKESHPDYKGSAKIGGREVWIAAWVKTSKNGVKFFSLAFNEKGATGSQDTGSDVDTDGGMPF